jgi:hypothetical protein
MPVPQTDFAITVHGLGAYAIPILTLPRGEFVRGRCGQIYWARAGYLERPSQEKQMSTHAHTEQLPPKTWDQFEELCADVFGAAPFPKLGLSLPVKIWPPFWS